MLCKNAESLLSVLFYSKVLSINIALIINAITLINTALLLCCSKKKVLLWILVYLLCDLLLLILSLLNEHYTLGIIEILQYTDFIKRVHTKRLKLQKTNYYTILVKYAFHLTLFTDNYTIVRE